MMKLRHVCLLLFLALVACSLSFGQSVLSSGLKIDTSGNLMINYAATGGTPNSTTSNGLKLDASGYLLVDVATGSASCSPTCAQISGTPVANQIAMWASATSVQGDTTLSDNGTTLAYSGTGGVSSASVAATGTGAGLLKLGQGADNSANCPANSDCSEAAAAIATSFTRVGQAAGPGALSIEEYGALSGGKTTKTFNSIIGTDTAVPSAASGAAWTASNIACGDANGGITSCGTIPSGVLAFPITISGTANSGGVPYFSSSTVLSSSAALAANGVVLGGGAGVAPSTSTSLTFSAGTLNVGTTGTTGILNINGTTAGVAAPITTLAGGLTLVFPTGTTTNPGQNYVSNNSNSGWVGNGSGGVNWVSSGTATGLIGANGFAVGNGGTLGFNRAGTRELGIGDESAATGGVVMSVDSGTIGNEGGLLRDANICRITADVALTVNVANSFCSFSVGGTARGWGFVCDVLWAITAGSGTNTFAMGVNASQTPTGTTNGIATITTATSGTNTNGSAAISASGATNILTGATYTPAATVLPARISGTVLSSATAGTFAITATANGTTATAAVKAGSVCSLL